MRRELISELTKATSTIIEKFGDDPDFHRYMELLQEYLNTKGRKAERVIRQLNTLVETNHLLSEQLVDVQKKLLKQ